MTGEPAPADLVVEGATVLPFDAPGAVVRGCDIVARGGRITAMGPGVARDHRAPVLLDGSDLLVLPGLCNAHTHSCEAIARGIADGAALDDWLRAVWSDLDALDEATIRTAVQLCAAEMLHGGATAVVDHFRQTPMRDDAVAAAADAWRQTGMRVTLAVMVRDRDVPDWVTVRDSAETQIDRVLRVHATLDDGDRLRIAFGPSAPTRCSDALLRAARDLHAANGIAAQMHVDETRREVELASDRFGCTSVAHLERLGVLGPHVSLAHCVWCSEDDLDRIAASGAAVVHNPVANLRLGSGRAPIVRMRARGIRVAIGTDGAASNDSQNLLEAVKLAALLVRPEAEDVADWITGAEALAMATRDAADIFGMSDGVLAAGRRADFAAFDLSDPPLCPLNDPFGQIALAGAALRARHVVIGGELVVCDHVIRTFDERQLRAGARLRS